MVISTRKGTLQLLIIMIVVSLIVTGISIIILYKVVINEKKDYLKELSENQIGIIKSIFKETKEANKVLKLLKSQREFNSDLGKTGEFIIAYLKNDSVFFLLDHLRYDFSNPKPIPLKLKIGIPIKYALLKHNGYIKGMDYSSTTVLAYCDYIPELQWGIVTKINVSEVNEPFYKAGQYAIVSALIFVFIGTFIFRKVSDPIVKRIIQSEDRYRNLFEFSAVPIWEEDFSQVKQYLDQLKSAGITDFKTYFEIHKDEISQLASLVKVVDINQKSVTFFDVDSKEEIITNLLFYFNEISLDIFKDEIITLAEGKNHFECEMPIRTLKGDIRSLLLHLTVMPGYEQTLKKVLVTFIDITARKKAEEQLRQYASELKDLNATKDKFFSIIAHDLKNPFSSLLGASEILVNNAHQYDVKNIVKFSTLMNDAAKRGYALLENLLEWSRSQTGSLKYNPKNLNIRDIIADTLSNIGVFATKKKIELRSDVTKDIQAFADKNMLNTILRNLLTNAIKFTNEGGLVSISAKIDGTDIIVTVKDSGIGIPKDDISKLFRIDTQYTNIGTAEERGTGLGLILCKEFVEKHDGKIWVESIEGKGSEFKFTIPLQ